MSDTRRGLQTRTLCKVIAVVGVVAALAHLWMAATQGSGATGAVLLVVMAVACLGCSVHMWRAPTVRTLLFAGIAATVMVILHVPLTAHQHHPGHGGLEAPVAAGGTLHVFAMGLALGELALILMVLCIGPRAAATPTGGGRRPLAQAEGNRSEPAVEAT